MMFTLGDILTPLGQVAAIILGIYMLINILIGLVFAVVFMFAVAWLGDKAELIKNLRPTVESVNTAIKHPEDAALPEGAAPPNRLVQAVHSIQAIHITEKVEGVQHSVQAVERKVDQGTDRISSAMIELRARTVQAQGIVKAFFLPGLTRKSTYRYALPETASSKAEPSLAYNTSAPKLPAASAPFSLAAPGGSGGEKMTQAMATGDESTGNASHA